MAFTASQLEILRRKLQYQQVYLAIESPITVWTGRVAGSPNPGANVITFSNENVIATPVNSYTLLVGSTAGARDKGVVRFRSKSGSTLTLGYNHIDWDNGDYLTIVRQVRPWALFPSVDGSKEDQDITYSNQNSQVDPIARIGSSAACAFRDQDGYARVKFYSNSEAVSGSLSSHAWTFEGGLPASSSSAGSVGTPIEVLFSGLGQHWVTYTVTDTNGKSSTRYCIVYVFDRDGVGAPLVQDNTNYGLSAFEVTSLTGNYEDGGWSLEFNSEYLRSNWLEGSQVVVFADQYWTGEQTNIGLGWSYRENILFSGWIKSSRTNETADKSYTTFSCYGPVGWLKEAEAWPANLTYASSGWHGLGASMTPDRASLHLLREHSNLDLLCDITLTGVSSSLLYVDCAEDRLYNQINNQILSSISARLLSDRLGRLIAEQNQQLIPVASRSADTLMIFTSEDWRDEISLGDEFDFTQVSQIDFAGFYYSGADPKKYYSLAPGRELSTGSIEQITGVRADTQEATNILAGLYLAWRNNKFQDVRLPLAGFMPMDIVPQQRISITLAASDTTRQLVWSAKSFWIRSVVHDLTRGSIATDITAEAESDGPPGVTNIIPDDAPPAYPDYAGSFDIPEITPTDVPEATVEAGDGNTMFGISYNNSYIVRTFDFLAVSPTWTDITGACTGTKYVFRLDPFDPANKATCLTSTGVWYSTNIRDTSPTWTQSISNTQLATLCGKTLSYDFQLCHMSHTIVSEGKLYVMILNATDSAGNYYESVLFKTSNYASGSSGWSAIVNKIWGYKALSPNAEALAISQRNPGYIFASVGMYSYPNVAGQLCKSTDDGVTWTYHVISGTDPQNGCHLFIPYTGNNDQIIYAGHPTHSGSHSGKFVKSTNGGASWSGITTGGLMWTPESMTESPIVTGGTATWVIIDDTLYIYDGTTLTGIGASPGSTSLAGNAAKGGFGGWPFDNNIIRLSYRDGSGYCRVYRSTDGGLNWTDCTGNISSIFTGTHLVYLVPIWVAYS